MEMPQCGARARTHTPDTVNVTLRPFLAVPFSSSGKVEIDDSCDAVHLCHPTILFKG